MQFTETQDKQNIFTALASHKLELKTQGTESCMYTVFYENDLQHALVFFNYILLMLYVFEEGKLGQKHAMKTLKYLWHSRVRRGPCPWEQCLVNS